VVIVKHLTYTVKLGKHHGHTGWKLQFPVRWNPRSQLETNCALAEGWHLGLKTSNFRDSAVTSNPPTEIERMCALQVRALLQWSKAFNPRYCWTFIQSTGDFCPWMWISPTQILIFPPIIYILLCKTFQTFCTLHKNTSLNWYVTSLQNPAFPKILA